jgi:hypothetical protein
MTNYINLKTSKFDEGDVQLSKRQYVDFTATSSTSAITVNTTNSTACTNTTVVTAILTIPKGMKVKFPGDF